MNLKGKNNEEKIWNYFKSKGLNNYACAGILGNAYAESGLRANNLQNTCQEKLGMTDKEYTESVDNGTYKNFVYDSAGYGIFQFTYWSRKKALLNYARKTNRSIGSLEMQLEYTWMEFKKDYPTMLNMLKKSISVLQASNAILFHYEKPADQSSSVQRKRASYSQKYYDKYAQSNTHTDNSTETEYATSFSKSLYNIYKTVGRLNLRKGAGVSKSILTTIPKGGKVVCYGYYSTVDGVDWYYVNYKSNESVQYTGFVSSKYLVK